MTDSEVKPGYITVEEYLRFEEDSQWRHEYVDGQVFAMTGGTAAHAILMHNLFSLLHDHVRGSKCRAFMPSLKLRAEATNAFYYPDLMVVCKRLDPSQQIVDSPVLVAEVLSPSTKHIDRREKASAYHQIESVLEYLIVYQDRIRVELHRRNAERWEILAFVKGEQLVLQSLPKPLTLSIDTIYEGLEDLPTVVREEESDYEPVSG